MSFDKIRTGSPHACVAGSTGTSFPVTERFVYLNHAAVAPLSRRAADAMKQLADDVLLNGSLSLRTVDGRVRRRASCGRAADWRPAGARSRW